MAFLFYQGAGQAIIDLFDLTITGREEAGADDLSATLLLATYADAYQVLVAVHAAFSLC